MLGCKHDWEVIHDSYTKSFMVQITEMGYKFNGKTSCEDTLGFKLVILRCKKCGKLNKTEERV